ncbi:hypothetical protein [Microlunatus parietis]|uniref:Uncharacterized protein n=1 Tax=Microlunatus parietis TaxID=682979 RepID=A0A7Y9I396_9ACTN|nr:hypothetical protein [Microlunatus parietis]NYE69455.1 hypothetical protein [Microlunatus parietis]
MSLLAGAELVAILAADSASGSELAGVIGGIYGAVSLLNGVSLMIFGIAALTAGQWRGWRRLILLVLGIYVIVPLTPAIFGPFVLARLTIAGWMLLFGFLGWALLRPEQPGTGSVNSRAGNQSSKA